MIRLDRFLGLISLIVVCSFVILLIPSTLISGGQSANAVHNATWFKWIFSLLFLSLSLARVAFCVRHKKSKSAFAHMGVLLIVLGAILSSGSTEGKVVVTEGEYFQSFTSSKEKTIHFPARIALLKFSEEDLSNTVEISGREHSITPSHPLNMWGYFFYAYDHDVKLDIRKVVVSDNEKRDYVFEPQNRKHFMQSYVVDFLGIAVNNDGDTLAEFALFQNASIVGVVFVGKDGVEMPSYGLNLRLVHSDFDVSYMSTILVKRDPGLYYALTGFVLCIIGLVISFPRKQWIV